MTGPDHLDRLLRPDVLPLPAPPGRFLEILDESRRRRRRSRLVPLLISAATVAAVMVGIAVVTEGAGSVVPAEPGATVPASTAPSERRPSGLLERALPAGGPVPEDFAARSVTTASADVFYVLGDAPGCDNAPCTSLVRGRGAIDPTWAGVSTPAVELASAEGNGSGASAPSADAVRDVRFASERDGWLFGGALWSTHDGAASTDGWTRVDVGGGSVLDLAVGGDVVWAVVADCVPAPCNEVRLFRSPIDRDEFALVESVDLADARIPDGGSTSVRLEAVRDQVTVQRVTAAGGVQVAVSLAFDGSDWRRFDSAGACHTGGAPQAVVPTSVSGQLVAFCRQSRGVGLVTHGVSRSDDGGTTWVRTEDTGGRRVWGELPYSYAVMDTATFALASGGSGVGSLDITQDGGATWTPAALPAQPQGWRYVGAASRTRLIALPWTPDGSVWSSDDSGRSWRQSVIG